MSKDRLKNVTASVRHRLTELARKQGEELQLVLTRYALERLLYRLSRSPHRDEFVLKGALLFRLWTGRQRRPTRDLDLLGRGESSADRLVEVFRAVCGQAVEDDGLTFDPDAVRAEGLKEGQEYPGVRVRALAWLGQVRLDLQIDVGFGDVVTPGAEEADYPALLDFPAARLRVYPRPTVVAEKFQAMVALGIANSRLKDFYDLWVLAHEFAFDGPTLARALRATFRRRRTDVPAEAPLALTAEFGTDAAKRKQWEAFIRKGKLDAGEATLEQVCAFLAGFLMPPARAVAAGEAFDRAWEPGGPWELAVARRGGYHRP